VQVTILVAMDKNNAIGKNNTLPWRISEDLKRFKQRTSNGVIIMGRNTWDSLPFKPLPNRVNVVLSSQGRVKGTDYTASSLEDAIDFARTFDKEEIFIIGGSRVYKEALDKDFVDTIISTQLISYEVQQADAFFPIIDETKFLHKKATSLCYEKDYGEVLEIQYSKNRIL